MKYYSDKTQKVYETEDALVEAERKYDQIHAAELKKAAERKERAEEIEKAYAEVVAAKKKYNDLVNAFVKDFSSYHFTVNGQDWFRPLFETFFQF